MRLPAVSAHDQGLVLVNDVHAVLLPGLPDAAPLRDDRRGLVGVEHVEADLAGVGEDGVLPVGVAADHPRDLDHERPVDELHRGELEVGVGGVGVNREEVTLTRVFEPVKADLNISRGSRTTSLQDYTRDVIDIVSLTIVECVVVGDVLTVHHDSVQTEYISLTK